MGGTVNAAPIIGLFIPIIAIIMTFLVPIMALYFWYRVRMQKSKERMLAIEKGVELPPEPVPVVKPATPLDSLRRGCVCLGIGVALIIFALVAGVFKWSIWFMGGGLILTSTGAALVIWYRIATRKEEE
ncbi:MAG: DUF6249 domain-containing protein [candidate division WOR-3 bacterium]|nr:DUF6249 domain-containing protein [candidate division WOR-3 bacterium]